MDSTNNSMNISQTSGSMAGSSSHGNTSGTADEGSILNTPKDLREFGICIIKTENDGSSSSGQTPSLKRRRHTVDVFLKRARSGVSQHVLPPISLSSSLNTSQTAENPNNESQKNVVTPVRAVQPIPPNCGSEGDDIVQKEQFDDTILDTTTSSDSPMVAKRIEVFYPSQYMMSEWAAKLELEVSDEMLNQTYKFWANHTTKYVLPQTRPLAYYTSTVPDRTGFICLSLLITGAETYHTIIMDNIKTNFYDNFKELGQCLDNDFADLSFDSPIIRKTILIRSLNDVLCQFVANFLNVRIGVFDEAKNGVLQRYGDWSDDKCRSDIPTFLLRLQNGNYDIVLSLESE